MRRFLALSGRPPRQLRTLTAPRQGHYHHVYASIYWTPPFPPYFPSFPLTTTMLRLPARACHRCTRLSDEVQPFIYIHTADTSQVYLFLKPDAPTMLNVPQRQGPGPSPLRYSPNYMVTVFNYFFIVLTVRHLLDGRFRAYMRSIPLQVCLVIQLIAVLFSESTPCVLSPIFSSTQVLARCLVRPV